MHIPVIVLISNFRNRNRCYSHVTDIKNRKVIKTINILEKRQNNLTIQEQKT